MPINRRQFLAASSLFAIAAQAQTKASDAPLDEVPFVVTPPRVVERMLQMAEITRDDRLIDLGSGDGRIVIAAALRGARAVGLEIDPALIKKSRSLAQAAGVAARTKFHIQDLFEADFSAYTVVTMYLLPEYNLKLRPKLLAQLKPGARVLSHDWDMGDWQPDETLTVAAPTKTLGLDRAHRVFLWVIPAQIAGRWIVSVDALPPVTFDLTQRDQIISGAASRGTLRALALRGTEVILIWNDGARTWRLVGRANGDAITGSAGGIGEEQGSAKWRARR